jgi:hypothetical protein
MIEAETCWRLKNSCAVVDLLINLCNNKLNGRCTTLNFSYIVRKLNIFMLSGNCIFRVAEVHSSKCLWRRTVIRSA